MSLESKTYEAKIVDWWCERYDGDDLKVIVEFQLKDPPERIKWRCNYNSDKARSYCTAMLKTMGSAGLDERFAGGAAAGALNQGQLYFVRVDMFTGRNGQEYPQIKSISTSADPSASRGTAQRLTPDEMKKMLKESAAPADKGVSDMPF